MSIVKRIQCEKVFTISQDFIRECKQFSTQKNYVQVTTKSTVRQTKINHLCVLLHECKSLHNYFNTVQGKIQEAVFGFKYLIANSKIDFNLSKCYFFLFFYETVRK